METAEGAYATAQAARVARLETMEAVRRGPMVKVRVRVMVGVRVRPNPIPDHSPDH